MGELDLRVLRGVRHRHVDVGAGVRLHVAEAGAGPPLVLVHGGRSTGGAGGA